MTCVPIGRINVPVAGTPVAITAPGFTQLPASGQVRKITVSPDPTATGRVYVKYGGVILAALPVVATGAVIPWSTPDCEYDQIQLGSYQIDAATNGDGAYVTLWIE